MKKILMTAAALTLGTSAYAWMPMQDGGSKVAGDKGATASAVWTQTAMSAWNEMKSGAKVETASADAVVPKAFADWTDPTVQTASLDTGAKVASEDGDIQIADNEFKAKDAVDGAMMASTDGLKVASEDGDIQIA
jgi:RNA 3'-terminal phosphate cyclase